MAEDKNIEIVLKGIRLPSGETDGTPRLSFLNVFEPQEFIDEEKGTVRFTRNLNALIPKKLKDGSPNPLVKTLNEAVKKAIENTWPGGTKKIPPERRCVRDGEPIDPDTVDENVKGSGTRYPLYEGYEGHIFVSANKAVKAKTREEASRSPNNVQCKGPRKTAKRADGTPCFPILTEADGLLYSGAYADVIIRIYGYDGKGKNPDRVNASLEAIKFVRHGEAFGAKKVDADAAFDEEDGDEGYDGASTGGSTADDDDIG